MTRRLDIQGLRALAVTLVILAHAGVPWVNGGFVGVDVFFVISGYLITRVVTTALNESGAHWYLQFLVKRLNRLLPALFVMLIATTGLALLLMSSFEFSEQAKSASYAAGWVSNIYFAFTTLDYFADLQQRDLFLHTWSLGVEEQFYIVWPIILVLAYARGWFMPLKRGNDRLLLVLASICAISLLLSLYWTHSNSLLAFYMMPARAWEFSLGALVFWHERNRSSITQTPTYPERYWTAIRIAGLAAIVGSAALLHEAIAYPGAWAMFPSVGTALVLLVGCRSANTGPQLLSHPWMVWIGDRSYSWYLWHWPLLMIGTAYGLQHDVMATSALVLLSLFIADASYRRIELPFWKGPHAGAPSLKTLSVYASLIVLAGTSLHYVNDIALDRGGKAIEISKAARNSVPAIYSMSCDSWFYDDNLVPCIFGPAESEHTVVLIGDSIGAQWFSALQALYPAPSSRIIVLTKSSCAIADLTYDYGPAGGPYLICNRWREKALEYLADIKPDLVFIGSTARYGFSKSEWVEGTSRILERIAPSAGQVILIPGTPQLLFEGPSCIERWLIDHDTTFPPSTAICEDKKRLQKSSQVAEYLREATQQHDNTHILSLNDLVCPNDICSAWQANGQIVFRDQQHLTDNFVTAQVTDLATRLRKLGVFVETEPR